MPALYFAAVVSIFFLLLFSSPVLSGRRLAVYHTSLNGGQPNFARCLSVSWDGTLYRFFLLGRGFLPCNGILPGAKLTLRASLVFSYIGSIIARTLLEWASARLRGVVQEMELRSFCSSSFSTEGATYIQRAAIVLGIGPHFSYGRPME